MQITCEGKENNVKVVKSKEDYEKAVKSKETVEVRL